MTTERVITSVPPAQTPSRATLPGDRPLVGCRRGPRGGPKVPAGRGRRLCCLVLARGVLEVRTEAAADARVGKTNGWRGTSGHRWRGQLVRQLACAAGGGRRGPAAKLPTGGGARPGARDRAGGVA